MKVALQKIHFLLTGRDIPAPDVSVPALPCTGELEGVWVVVGPERLANSAPEAYNPMIILDHGSFTDQPGKPGSRDFTIQFVIQFKVTPGREAIVGDDDHPGILELAERLISVLKADFFLKDDSGARYTEGIERIQYTPRSAPPGYRISTMAVSYSRSSFEKFR